MLKTLRLLLKMNRLEKLEKKLQRHPAAREKLKARAKSIGIEMESLQKELAGKSMDKVN